MWGQHLSSQWSFGTRSRGAEQRSDEPSPPSEGSLHGAVAGKCAPSWTVRQQRQIGWTPLNVHFHFLNMLLVPFTLIKSFVCWQERSAPIFTARRPCATVESCYICSCMTMLYTVWSKRREVHVKTKNTSLSITDVCIWATTSSQLMERCSV